ncbi:MAG: hypothetical protein R8G60_04870 [Roseovarius pacificus]|nr:hypothetical protein [Roseovarius pacificus]
MMNEWGIPNWQDISGYGDTSEWNENRWRWEFLRRRSDLRDEFDAKANRQFENKRNLYLSKPEMFPGGLLTPEDPGFCVSTFLICGELQSLPNPRIGNQPWWAIEWTDKAKKVRQFTKEIAPEGYERVDFDLSKPIAPQLEFAKEYLLDIQRELHGKALQVRRTPAKWFTYLRVLDAREAGASWSDIASLLPNTVQSSQTARDVHKQATALCFNF